MTKLKYLFSLLALMFLFFALGSEAMAAKKSKTLKNTNKKGFCKMWGFARSSRIF